MKIEKGGKRRDSKIENFLTKGKGQKFLFFKVLRLSLLEIFGMLVLESKAKSLYQISGFINKVVKYKNN